MDRCMKKQCKKILNVGDRSGDVDVPIKIFQLFCMFENVHNKMLGYPHTFHPIFSSTT